MGFITAGYTVVIPDDPNKALVESVCGVYGYQPLIPGVSGLIPNPQSSGDFSATTISGILGGIIMKYYRGVSSQGASSISISGVNYLLSSGVQFDFAE